MTVAQMLPVLSMFILLSPTHSAETPVTINTFGNCGSADGQLERRIEQLEETVHMQNKMIMDMQGLAGDDSPEVIRDCSDVWASGNRSEGIYTVRPDGSKSFKVYCEFDGEGLWTVIQRRNDGSTDFQRSWKEFERGFGHLQYNFWLGNEKIFKLSNQRQYQLRVDITDWDEYTHFALYRFFLIDGADNFYAIHYANYSGTAGDSLAHYHNNMRFSTFDKDNDMKSDEHCAEKHGGGWWYNGCDNGNLNGYYNYNPELKGPTDGGIEWDSWKQMYSFKASKMRIKPTFNDPL